MEVWFMLGVVSIAGAVGGVINALLTDQGFIKPYKQRNENIKIYRPGFLGNIFTGAVAAGISWGLYGPLSSHIIMGVSTQPSTSPAPNIGLTISSLVGAVLVGVGGARWLTNEVDKSLLKTAVSMAAAAKPSPEAAERIALASPTETLEIIRELDQEVLINTPKER